MLNNSFFCTFVILFSLNSCIKKNTEDLSSNTESIRSCVDEYNRALNYLEMGIKEKSKEKLDVSLSLFAKLRVNDSCDINIKANSTWSYRKTSNIIDDLYTPKTSIITEEKTVIPIICDKDYKQAQIYENEATKTKNQELSTKALGLYTRIYHTESCSDEIKKNSFNKAIKLFRNNTY